MIFLRKKLFPLVALVLTVFLSALALSSTHHHEGLESHDDCSVCAWQASGSQAPDVPTGPILFYALLLAFLFTFTPFYFSHVSISPSGRSPPQILL